MVKKMMTNPCNLNTEPYLTEWHADLESGMEIWIQTSEDIENPRWIRLGNLMEKIYKEYGAFAQNGVEFSIQALHEWL